MPDPRPPSGRTVRRLDRGIDLLLLATFVLTPAMLGAPAVGNFTAATDLRDVPWIHRDVAFAYGEFVFIALAAAMLALLGAKLLIDRSFRLVRSGSLVAIAAFLLLGAAQLIELPRPVAQALSPASLALRAELLGDLPNASARSSTALSVYAEATRQNLRVLVALVAVFVVVLNQYRTVESMQRVLRAMAVVGGVYCVVAIVQPWTSGGRILWSIPTSLPPRGGPFVNPNNFAQFASLTLAAAMAAALYRLRRSLPRRDGGHTRGLDWVRDPRAREVVVMLIIALFAGVAVALSLSRGGLLSLAAGIAIAASVLAGKRDMPGRAWAIAAVSLVVLLAALLLGAETLARRVGTLGDAGTLQRDRLDLLASVSRSWPDYPLVGSGLGTFAVLFPGYDRTAQFATTEYADSDWAQLMNEGGVVGLAIVLGFAAVVTIAWGRAVRGRASSAGAVAAGLGIGWVAVVLQSGVDLGQHLPGVAMFTACVSAMLLNLPASRRDERTGEPIGVATLGRRASVVGMVALSAAAAWATRDGLAAARAERSFVAAFALEQRLRALDWRGTEEEYRRLVGFAEDAAERRPGNAHYRYWAAMYLLRYLEAGRDPATGELQLVREEVELLRDRFDAVRALAPTFGPAYLAAGGVRHRYLGDAGGITLVERGRRLDPNNPEAIFFAGELALERGDVASAAQLFDEAAGVEPGTRARGVAALLAAKQVDAAIALAGESLDALDRVHEHSERAGDASLVERLKPRVLAALETAAQAGEADAITLSRLGAARAERGEHERAVVAWRLALRRDASRLDWRASVVRSLIELGRDREAEQELQVILQMDPANEEAGELMNRLRERAR
jgi:hypothetical protein